LHGKIKIEKDIKTVDGIIMAGEYECLYDEGDFHYIRVGDYVVGIHNSFLNTTEKTKVVEGNVSSSRKRLSD